MTQIKSLRVRKGLLPLENVPDYAGFTAQPFDMLTQALCQHIDIARIYQEMREHQE